MATTPPGEARPANRGARLAWALLLLAVAVLLVLGATTRDSIPGSPIPPDVRTLEEQASPALEFSDQVQLADRIRLLQQVRQMLGPPEANEGVGAPAAAEEEPPSSPD